MASETIEQASRLAFLLIRLNRVPPSKLEDYQHVLVIAPHPDDEVFGLGGYLLQQIPRHGTVSIIYVTDGEKSLPELPSELVSQERQRLCEEVLRKLGVPDNHVYRLHLPDGSIPGKGASTFHHAVKHLVELISKIHPEAIFVTHCHDGHRDHKNSYEMTEEAARNISFPVDVYAYWVWLWYLIPIKRIASLDWCGTIRLPVHKEASGKRLLVRDYLEPLSPIGKPWIGVLPKLLVRLSRYPYEIVTKMSP